MTEHIETVIIGGGQAGLAMSYHLKQMSREHVILERANVADRWRTQRWDSLVFQFPNWSISLPGQTYSGNDPDEFSHKDAILRFIQDYAENIQAPIRTKINVSRLRAGKKDRYLIVTDLGDFEACNVVIATGPYQQPNLPQLSDDLNGDVQQMHVSEYHNPSVLPKGAILVVGSGASGCQVADELLECGRLVYLSVGRHHRMPRRYRGRDLLWWLQALGWFDIPTSELPEWLRPQRFLITGIRGGYDIDLRRSATRGMVLLGHLAAVTDDHLMFEPNLEENLSNAEQMFRRFISAADAYATSNNLDLPMEVDHSEPTPTPAVPDSALEIKLSTAGITTIIWATGYRYDFSWIEIPVLDVRGDPIHMGGITHVPGIYFLGLRLQRNLKSSTLWGVGEDAAYLAARFVDPGSG
jgi:putative flavoprotein involved in K+ transport